MKDSDFLLLTSMVVLAPHLSKGLALIMWAIYFVAFCAALYLGR